MATKTRSTGLPEGVYKRGMNYYRDSELTAPDGSIRTQPRPVALGLEEAKAKRWDYFHPEFGWIIEGYKLAKDRTVRDIMADGTTASMPFDENPESKQEE